MHIICQPVVDHNNSIRKVHVELCELSLAVIDFIGNCTRITLKNAKTLLRRSGPLGELQFLPLQRGLQFDLVTPHLRRNFLHSNQIPTSNPIK